tara:strand:+ start:290 stop:448 length:159 start_codon:yes stop_codon:yes gene_type:complete
VCVVLVLASLAYAFFWAGRKKSKLYCLLGVCFVYSWGVEKKKKNLEEFWQKV